VKNLEELGKIIEKEINNLPYPNTPALLYDPIQYIMGMKGKRIRPFLVSTFSKISKIRKNNYMRISFAIESIHSY